MKHTHRRTHGWIVCAVTVAIICIMGGCKPEKTTASVIKLPEKTPVMARPATRISTNRVISVSGTLTADKTVPLSFLVQGKVSQIFVDEGDHVKKGALLATVEPSDYKNNLDIAEASSMRANDAFKRYEPLYKEGAFAEKNLIELKAGLAQAAAARNIARKALADTRLYASIPGIVGAKSIEIGQMVSPQVPAFIIVKTDVIYARISVPESEIGQVAMGQNAEVTISAIEDRTFIGRVSMIGAMADERTRTYTVKIELVNPDYILRPGMIVQTDIQTSKSVNMLTVPGSVIIRDADNLTYVFVADAKTGLAQKRRITPGSAYGNEIEIKNGLSPEDAVIVSGQHKLSDGASIAISNTDTKKEDRS